MDALRSRLSYQLPEEPTVDNIAAIAKARDNLNDQMQQEWERTITVSWGEMLKQKLTPTPRAGEHSQTLGDC
jgi:hypothetical protein